MCIYPPATSSFYKSNPTLDPYQELNDKVVKYQSIGDVLITGDFNARTSSLNDFLKNDNDEYLPVRGDLDFYNADSNDTLRCNSDKNVNSFGKKILQVCKENSLRILNGRIIGDLLGNYTCTRYNGKSVVDYAILSKCLLSKITYFRVIPDEEITDTALSDHSPILLNLEVRQNIVKYDKKLSSNRCQNGFLWKSDSQEKYKETLKLPIIQNEINKIMTDETPPPNQEGVDIFFAKWYQRY